MLRSRFGRWLIDEALPSMAFVAGYTWVPDDPTEVEAPSLRTQLAELLEVVVREEKRWGARHRIGERR